MANDKTSTRKPAYEKKNSYSAEAWRKQKAARNLAKKAKWGAKA